MISILKRLIKSSSIYGMGRFIPKAIGFLLIPVYTRFLTTGDYGIVAVATSISSIFSIIVGMGLRGAVTRHYFDYEDNEKKIKDYMGTVLIYFLISGITIVLILSFFGEPVFDLIFSEVKFMPFIILALWIGYFHAARGILLGYYRAKELALRYISFEIGNFLLSIMFIIYFVVTLHQGAIGKIKGSFLGSTILFVVFLFLMSKISSFKFSFSRIKKALSFGLPLVPHLLSAWVLASADRILLERMTDLSEVGIYNLGYQIGRIMNFVVSSINYAWSPLFYDTAKKKKNPEEIFSRMMTLYTVFISFIAVFLILYSKEIVLLMAAKPYHEAYIVIPAVVVGYLFHGLYFMSVAPIFYKKKTYIMPFITGMAAVTNVVLNIIWIPRYGMMGAAYATLIAFGLQFIVSHIYAQRIYRIKYNYRKILTVIFLVGIVYTINSILHLQGILIPVLIKTLVLFIFGVCIFMFRVIKLNKLKTLFKLFEIGEEDKEND